MYFLSIKPQNGIKNHIFLEAAPYDTNLLFPPNDASPREIFIAACFLLLIVGIGVYPKLATQMYDVKTVAINAEVRHSQTIIAQQQPTITQLASLFTQ